MSLQISPAIVARAESDVWQAYILQVIPTADQSDPIVRNALMNLAFLLVLQRSVKATRSGAKVKSGANSTNADGWDVLAEQAKTAAFYLRELSKQQGAVSEPVVTDICGLFVKSLYFSNDVKII